jgi:Flp pilus assembly protein TadG
MRKTQGRRFRETLCEDREVGNAQVEFIGVIAVLLIPILYFMIALSQVQAATYAAHSTAHAIARSHAISQEGRVSRETQLLIAELAFEDFGLAVTEKNLRVSVACETACAAGASIETTVSYTVKPPGASWLPRGLTVSAQGYSYRGELRE